jgi:capsular polysaccharide export protein
LSEKFVILITSRGIEKIAGLSALLGQSVKMHRRGGEGNARAVAGWGMKPTAVRARKLAETLGLAYWSLEDGFLRSVGVGQAEQTLSLVVDDLGIYYDARGPSRLEALIAEDLVDDQLDRARGLQTAWCAARVSKYNHGRLFNDALPLPYVLVGDQTKGDASVACGLADEASFDRMLSCALAENPEATILLKVHPEVMQGRKQGYFDVDAVSRMPRVKVLASDAHPVGLIENAAALYVVTSQMGFEGLLWGKRVRTFGMPFYAGWGLTEDELPAPDRRKPVALENLVHAALVAYPRYIDPETNERCEPERVIEWMGLQRRMRERFPEKLCAVGFSDWKKPIIRDFFQGSSVEFVKGLQAQHSGRNIISWGVKKIRFGEDSRLFRFMSFPRRRESIAVPLDSRLRGNDGSRERVCEEVRKDLSVIRLEDGFLRSVGLGADLVRPLSWVMDGRGMYYDATQPSDLENILQTQMFDDALLARAAALYSRIVASGLTKYNVGTGGWQRPVGTQRVILVPGQVESDASIAFGAPEGVCTVRRNMDLLRAVRQANPDAYVVYKPHPDVLAGLRVKGVDEDAALQWCDEQVIDIPMGEMLGLVDEVHVITSLAGFEALLRGKQVTCYGQPFYSGWGLTMDIAPVSRRTRRLSLNALVAGALILYPTYVSRTTGRFTTPERALDELLLWREQGASTLPWWRKLLRIVLRFYKR